MTQLTPEIAEDIQMIVNFVRGEFTRTNTIKDEKPALQASDRVEVYLSNFKPDHL